MAFLISNHEDGLTLRPFLEEIKKRCEGDIKINAVMTDDDNAGWNAFKNTFGESKHLLFKWHIKKTLRGKLPLCGPTTIQEEVYEVLETIIDEKDESKFLNLLEMFVLKYKTIYPSYIKYFEEYYVKRKELWALCYATSLMEKPTRICLKHFIINLKHFTWIGGQINV